MDELGRLLRQQRAKTLWPQQKVADACGLSRQQLSRYETGAAAPTWAVFQRVLAAYGMQPRIELEPLDADIVKAIERQRKRPRSEWLIDVGFAAASLHRLLTGIEWQVVHVVDQLHGSAVQIDADEWRWPVASVDRLTLDDPWMARVLDHLRRDRKPADRHGSVAYSLWAPSERAANAEVCRARSSP